MKTFVQFLNERHDHYHAQPGESEVVYSARRTQRTPMPGDHWGPSDAARARSFMIATKGKAPEWDKMSALEKYRVKNQKFDTHIARINLGKVAHIEDTIHHTPEIIAKTLHDTGHIMKNHYDHLHNELRGMQDRHDKYKHLAQSLKKHAGIDTISYTNEVEAPGKKSYITLDPKRVRILNTTKGHINLKRGSENVLRF